MAIGQCSIYSLSKQTFNFDDAFNFFTDNGFDLMNPETGFISALDEEGDTYEISYDLVKIKVLTTDLFHLLLWYDLENYMIWAFHIKEYAFIENFYFDALIGNIPTEIDQASKVLFSLFLRKLLTNSVIGMYIDKFAETEDYDWDSFFLSEDMVLDFLPGTICVKKEKMKYIQVPEDYHVQELGNDFVLITCDLIMLSCL